jgi:cytochrome c oxidase cbb3-type subunit 3
MLNEVLQSIKGIAIYPVIGLFIFVAAFIYVIVYTWRMKKSDVESAGRLPFDDGTVESHSAADTGRETGKGDGV